MHDQGTINRALAVLEEAVESREPSQTKAVALALWVLRGKCPDEWLTMFWDAAGDRHDIGHSQTINAAYNGIVLRARKAK